PHTLYLHSFPTRRSSDLIIIIFGNTEKDMYITVGSDHTDRELEAVNIGKSKQVCGKPFGKKAWKLDDVLTHWDELILSSEQYLEDRKSTRLNSSHVSISY